MNMWRIPGRADPQRVALHWKLGYDPRQRVLNQTARSVILRQRTMTFGAILVCAGLAGFAAQSASAQATAPATVPHDTDSDQTLDLAEAKAAASAHFDKLNKDGDQTLD